MDKKFSIEAQLKELGVELSQLTTEIEVRAKQALQLLAVQTHAKIIEKASAELKSTRNTYIQNLGMINESDNVYVVYLKKSAAWIEDGLPPGEMYDRILNNGKAAKVSKDGHKYKTIPFEHSKPTGNQSLAQQRISSFAKTEIKRMGLDKPIMAGGKPVIGKAAVLNITGKNSPVGRFNQQLLSGLTIYQREVKSKSGKTSIKRDIFTFRTISDKQRGSGLWYHPGSQAKNFFGQVEKEIEAEWNKMINEIVDSVLKTSGGGT